MTVDTIVNWLWEGVVVAAALALLLPLLERARAGVRYAVCWAALLCVLALPLVPVLVSLESPLAGVPMAVAAVAPLPQGWGWWMPAAATVWVAWVAVAGARLGWAALALGRARRESRPMPASVEASLRHWSGVRGTGRRARLVVSDRVTAAAVLGWGPPLIAVSPTLLRRLDAGELDRVVIHEWAHVQRRDDLTYGAQRLAGVVAGWHPAVWWIDRRLHVEREVACDELAVSVTGSAKCYAACLVKVASLPLGAAVPLPAPGMAAGAGLRRRIARIVSRRGFAAPAWSLGAATVAVSLIAGLSVGVGSVQWVEGAPMAQAPGILLSPMDSGTPNPNPNPNPNTEPRTGNLEPRTEKPEPGTGNPEPGTRRPPVAPALMAPPPEASLMSESGVVAPEPVLEAAPISIPATPAVAPALAEDRQAPARTPWAAVAAGGAAVGRASAHAGESTAGFFTRAAQGIAGAF